MRAGVAFEVELVSAEGTPLGRQPLRLLLHQLQVATRNLAWFRIRQLIHQHHLRPQRGHHAGTLARVPFRHDRYEFVALDPAHDRQPRTSVTAGQFHHGLAGLEPALRFRVIDDLSRDPVLFGETWIEVFQLGKDAAIHVACEAAQFHQRGVADRFIG